MCDAEQYTKLRRRCSCSLRSIRDERVKNVRWIIGDDTWMTVKPNVAWPQPITRTLGKSLNKIFCPCFTVTQNFPSVAFQVYTQNSLLFLHSKRAKNRALLGKAIYSRPSPNLLTRSRSTRLRAYFWCFLPPLSSPLCFCSRTLLASARWSTCWLLTSR